MSTIAAADWLIILGFSFESDIDEEAFARLYGHESHPFPVKKGQQIAIRVISQFGEETTKVLTV